MGFKIENFVLKKYSEEQGITDVIIPDGVYKIAERAFLNCTTLESITIPDGVREINHKTFDNCTSLRSIEVSENNKTYASEEGILFSKDKTKLIRYPPKNRKKEDIIPDGVIEIGHNAFKNCINLRSIIIPNSVTKIGRIAFKGCTRLTSVIIPNSVTEICIGAFWDCTSLNLVTIPDSVTKIDRDTFCGCTSLETINVSSAFSLFEKSLVSDTKWYKDQSDFVILGSVLIEYRGTAAEVTIPDSVKIIGARAFAGCTSLTSVTIHDKVTKIGYEAFFGCTGLTSITIPDSVTEIRDFSRCISLETINVSSTFTLLDVLKVFDTKWYQNQTDFALLGGVLIKYKGNASEITIPDSVTEIGSYAFEDCTSLTSVTIHDRVTKIGRKAFYRCTGLTLVTMADSVTEIADRTFEGCTSLNSFTIPNSVTEIGNSAFSHCTSLASVKIPNSVTKIGQFAFDNCTSLASVVIPDSVTEIWYKAFGDCTSLASVVIPDSVTEIDGAFEDCTSLNVIKFYLGNQIIERTISDIYRLSEELSDGIYMIQSCNYSIKLNHEIKYPYIILKFLRDRDEETTAYIKKNLTKIMKESIPNGDVCFISALCETDKFFTKRNIDKFIEMAHQEKKVEVAVMLMNYKNNHFGADDPLKDFKL